MSGGRLPGRGDETIVAASSPPGPAPRSVVRLSGPAAFETAARVFLPDAPGRFARGWRAGTLVLDASGAGARAEAWFFPAPASYTGEDIVELHVPGAPKLVDLVLRRLAAGGARLAAPGEFTRRALLNGRMDLTRAEAVCATIRARDEDEHKKARALLEGGLAREVASFEDRVIALLVPIELELDFSDQDVTVLDAGRQAAKIGELAAELARFGGASRPEARRLLPRIVLRGPANAGKSTLFNALLGRDVAIAAPVRGTTRDVLCAEWRHGDARALLVDTAGDDVRATALDALADAARERALLEADFVVEVRDVRAGGWPDPSADAVIAATMADLCGAGVARPEEAVLVSSVTGSGLEVLAQRIVAALARGSARRAEPFLVTARHAEHLGRARAALEQAARVVESDPPEIAASDLRAALRELRAIRGAEGGDPVLDRIFREFCIGK
jgi:tRNA modification GTPase